PIYGMNSLARGGAEDGSGGRNTVQDGSKLVRQRITRFVRERLVPAVYRERVPTEVPAWAAPGEPVPFAEAVRQEYSPFTIGSPWGRPWGTVWFHLTGAVPAGWTDPGTRPELVVDLGFAGGQPGFQSEGLGYAPHGTAIAPDEPPGPPVTLHRRPGSPA